MTAQKRYITSLLSLFSTHLDKSSLSIDEKLAAQELLVEFLDSRNKITEISFANLQQWLQAREPGYTAEVEKPARQILIQFAKSQPLHQTEVFLYEFLLALKEDKCSKSTVKNYRSDINQFLDLAQFNEIDKLLTKTKLHRFYLSQRAKGLKDSTITRKFSSIVQFGLWLKQENLLSEPPAWLETGFIYEPPSKLAEKPVKKIKREIKKVQDQSEKKRKNRKPQPRIKFPKNYQAKAQKNQEQRAHLKADLNQLSAKIQRQFGQTVKKFVPSGFLPFINTAVLVIFFLGASALGYKQFFTDAPINLAYPTAPTAPGRTLSFQGRLTDQTSSPITEETDMTFKLWNTESAGTEVDCNGGGDENCLWKSTAASCTVDPDQDGIFDVGLGDSADCPPTIPDEVFTENSNVWLEVTVETETLSPRQPIRTVGYATNAETVQGFPLAPTGGATTNTVLSMNNDGTILLAEDSPKLESTSGTFTVEGTSIVIQTTSNGNITLAPNGTGDINLQSSDIYIDKYLKHASDDDTYLHYPDAEDSVEIYAGNVGFMTITEDDSQDKIEFGDDTNDTDVSFNDNDLFIQGSDSKVGIGTTTPDYELDVAGNIGLDQYLYHNGDADTYLNYTDDNVAVNVGGETLINLTEDGSQDIVELGDDGDVDIKLSAGADGALFVQGSDGNVGIGTTTPNAKLHVIGPNGTSGSPAAPDVLIITGGNAYAGGNGKGSNISLTAGNGSELAGSGGDITLTAGDGAWDGSGNGGNIHLIAGLDGDGIRDDILLTGNVGVNTTTPSYPLEVNGSAVAGGIYLNSSDVGIAADADLISLASGALTVNGSLTTTGAISAPTSTDTINGLVIDGSGVITSGTWNGTAIGAGYGGTGDDTSSTTGVPYITAGNWLYEAALDETRGGTGQSAYTTGDILYSSASNTLDKLGIGSEDQVLTVTSGIPAWEDATGGGSSAWDDITDPDANLNLDMTTYTTTFNWATGTSTNDLFSFTTDASADGTGSLVNIQTGAGSTVIPFHVRSGSIEGLTVAASGNVGIGTTTPTNAKLDVVGGINASGAINATGALSTDSTLTLGSIGSTGDNNRILTSSAAGSGTVQYIDSTDWDKDTSDDLSGSGTTNYVTKWTTGGSVLGDSQIFDDGTNVGIEANTGINTTTPDYDLDVAGNIGLDQYIYHNGDADTFLNFTDDNLVASIGNENMISITEDDSQDIIELGDDGDVDIKLSAGADGALFVQGSDGNVGVGTTTPDYNLDVAGNIGLDQYIYHNGDADTFFNFTDDNLVASIGNENMISITEDDSQDIIKLADEGDIDINLAAGRDGALFVQGSDGNVGVGTTTPGAMIQAYDGSAQEQFKVAADGADGGIVYADTYKDMTGDADYRLDLNATYSLSASGAIVMSDPVAGENFTDHDWVGIDYTHQADDNVDLNFGQYYSTDGSFQTKMMIDGVDGNVGIGTTTPEYALEVTNSFNVLTGSASTFGSYSKSITISSSNVSSNISNYPLLFSITDSDLATTGNGGHIQNTDATGGASGSVTVPADLVFSSDVNGNNILDFEIEEYDASTGKLIAYVEIPTLSSSTNTTIYVVYGDAGTTTSQENVSGTWDNYAGVWHLNETSSNYYDSSSNSNNSSAVSVTSRSGSGQIGTNAPEFDGTDDYITVSDANSLDLGSYTLEAWVNADDTNDWRTVSAKGTNNNFNWYTVFYEDHSYNRNGYGTSASAVSSTTYGENAWVHLVAITDESGSEMRLYKNGSEVSYTTQTWSGASDNNADDMQIGTNDEWGEFFDGHMDELRLSSIVRSDAYISATYSNQNNPSGFYSVGSEQSLSGSAVDTLTAIDTNVGIGTTSPDYKLDVAGNIGLDQYIYHNGDADTYFNFTADNLAVNVGGETLISLVEDGTQDIVELGDDGDVDIKLSAGADGALFVQGSDGYVGVGTTTPSRQLEIHNSDDSSVEPMAIYNDNGDIAFDFVLNSTGGGLLGINDSSETRDIQLYAGGNVFFNNNGNVGIGTTNPIYGKLEVKPTANDASTGIALFTGSGSTARSWIDSSGNWLMTRGTTATNGISMKTDGNVGIGTTNPTGELNVIPSATIGGSTIGNAGILVGTTSSGIGIDTNEIYAKGTNLIMGVIDTANDIRFQQGTNNLMSIDGGTGNVGIGTTNPTSANLQVVGSTHISSNATIKGNTTIEGSTVTLSGIPGLTTYNNYLMINPTTGGVYYYTGASSIRYKKDVVDLSYDYNKYLDLQAVNFTWKESGERDLGLIAEDTEPLIPELVFYNEEGQVEGINYHKIPIYNLAATVKQGLTIELLKQTTLNHTFALADLQLDLTDTGDFQLKTDTTAPNSFQVTAADGSLIDRVSVLAEALIANLKAGFIQAEKIATSTLSATEAKIDELTTNRINLGEFELTEKDGNLQIKNKDQETVATIDQDGNTHISGNISSSSETQTASESSSLSSLGELLAENVNAENINTTNLSATGSARLQKLQAAEISTETIKATGSSKLGSLLTDTASISGQLQADSIQASTLEISGETKLGQLAAQSTNTQKLEISNDTQEIIANIDNTGTANFENLNINQDLTASHSRLDYLESKVAEMETIKANTAELMTATVSGTLYADHIDGFDEKVAEAFRQPSLLGSLLGESDTGNTTEVIAEVDSAGYTATSSAQLQQTIADLKMDVDDIVITPQAAYIDKYFEVNGSGYISDSLGVGQHLLIGDGLKIKASNGTAALSYLSESNPAETKLEIQPQGVGQVSILAGTMIINDTGQVVINGDLQLNGNLAVNGQTQTDTLLTNMIQPEDYDQPTQIRLASRSGQVAGASTENGETEKDEVKKSRLEIIDEEGTPVATISASGRAEFADGLGIDQEDLSATSSGEIVAEKSSGKALIGSGMKELTIKSDRITEDTQIFVTPIGSTNNQVLYVKDQTAHDPDEDRDGEFVVGFDLPASDDIKFSWWIVN